MFPMWRMPVAADVPSRRICNPTLLDIRISRRDGCSLRCPVAADVPSVAADLQSDAA